ncbi:phage scaffolding protein [Saccharothrix xinjiangensis]|uniref:Phage scaffolding protein n=1 Tax=Saccharothrix xinjiangensis TaxID=204798 RepID=A0ABV9XYX4_9PSEU
MTTSTIYLSALPVHPHWGTALAVLDDRPVWPVRGGADDDEGDTEIDLTGGDGSSGASSGGAGRAQRDILDDEPDDDDEHGDKPEGEQPAESDWKPPTQEEWQRTQAALKEANKQAANERWKLTELKKAQRQAQKEAGPKPEAGSLEAARAEAAAEAEARLMPIAIRATAKAALLAANFQRPTEARVKRMIGRIDMAGIEIDDDGEVIGLDEEIERLQEELPELFTPPAEPAPPATAKRRPTRINPADKQPTAPQFATTGDRLAARIKGDV